MQHSSISLKATLHIADEAKTCFRLNENDVSMINLSQIKQKLEFPNIVSAGDRLKYEFKNTVDVDVKYLHNIFCGVEALPNCLNFFCYITFIFHLRDLSTLSEMFSRSKAFFSYIKKVSTTGVKKCQTPVISNFLRVNY